MPRMSLCNLGGNKMEEMTAEIFYQIMNAREVLCAHCELRQQNSEQSEIANAQGLRSKSFGSNESDRCPSCQVTAIVDNAQIQAQMFGIFD